MKIDNSTNSNALKTRIEKNSKYQAININEWAFKHIEESNDNLKILELCSGIGNQTKFLLTKFPNSTIHCLDISLESLGILRKNLEKDIGRLIFINQSMDDFFKNNIEKFDIIFCSYGLYYAKDINYVLDNIYSSLNVFGRLIVMGPYGENNKEIFDVTIQAGVKIAPFVVYSSSKFMEEPLQQFCKEKGMNISIVTTANEVRWDDVTQVMDYWKNSTFYLKESENKFRGLVSKRIQEMTLFINTKQIMLLNAQKIS